MWCCFILPLSTFYAEHMYVGRCCWCFSYDFSIVRLRKCLFVQLKPEIQTQSQAALHYEFTDFSFQYFTYEVRSSFEFHPVLECFYLHPPEKSQLKEHCGLRIAKWANMHISWMCYLFIFSHFFSLVLAYTLTHSRCTICF